MPIENSFLNCSGYCQKAVAITFLLPKLLTPSMQHVQEAVLGKGEVSF
jgi:hypothetical protein